MVCMLVDYNNIIEPKKIDNIKKFLGQLPSTEFSIGIFFDITKETYTTFDSLPDGNSKVDFINSGEFINNINGYSYIVYDKEKKLCEIILVKGDILEKTLDKALESLPNDILIMFFVSMEEVGNEEVIQYLAQLGFGDPFTCDDLVFFDKKEVPGIFFIKLNFFVEPKIISNDIRYLLQSVQNDVCNLSYKFTPTTIKKLKYLSKIGSSWNKDDNITQKEIAGIFLSKINDSLITELELDENSILYGEEEGVNVVGGLYNFHSHPLEAYERNKVSLGWPSGQDYIGFLASYLHYNTILHVVIALEGVYIISLSDFLLDNNDIDLEQISKFIKDNFSINCKDKLTSQQYTEQINNIKLDDKCLFNLIYISWENINNTFEVRYKKINGNCVCDENINNFLHFYR